MTPQTLILIVLVGCCFGFKASSRLDPVIGESSLAEKEAHRIQLGISLYGKYVN